LIEFVGEQEKSFLLMHEIEARLFLSPKGMSLADLRILFPNYPENEIRGSISFLTAHYVEANGALEIYCQNDFYILQVKPILLNSPYLRQFIAGREFSKAEVEILAFIAYHQPIELQDIMDFIGPKAKKIIIDLEKRGFIQKREENEENTILKEYVTTEQFAHFLGVTNEKPTIKKAIEQAIGNIS